MGLLFVILLIVVGYFGALGLVLSKYKGRGTVMSIALTVLLVYGCAVAAIIALGDYVGQIGLVLYALAITYSCIFWLWKLWNLRSQREKLRLGVLAAIVAYVIAILYFTTFMRQSGTNSGVQMTILNFILAKHDGDGMRHFLLNLAMFIPLGVLYPMLRRSNRGELLSAISFGLLISVCIETGQLISSSGTCDIDDILANTLGTALGALAMTMIQKRAEKRKQTAG